MQFKQSYRLLFLFFSVLLLSNCKVDQKVELPLSLNPLFSDHMVLQQEDEVSIWGKYTAQEEIQVSATWGAESKTNADENGHWTLKLKTNAAGGPYQVSVSSKDSTIQIEDVFLGEVWLASGQSNMEMSLMGYLPAEPIDNNLEEIANANYPMIRFYDVERNISQNLETIAESEWVVTKPESAETISATAYFFARKLHQELKVPIGIINSTWGGTPVEAWMSKEKIVSLGEFEKELEGMQNVDTAVIYNYVDQFESVGLPADLKKWNSLDFKDMAFSKEDYNDSSWEKVTLPDVVENFYDEIATDGVFWFRKDIIIDDLSSDYEFTVSKGIDDMDVTFVNGVEVGREFCWNCPRKYTIPKSVLKQGKNNIAIRVTDTYGAAGFAGKMGMKNAAGKQIPIEGEWSFFHAAEFYMIKGKQQFYLTHLNPSASPKPASFEFNSLLSTPNAPFVLYNGMIHPLLPYTLKGAIWYQGESNVGRAKQYEKLFPGMIMDWREKWERDFPFYFVQIAPFDYSNGLSPALRDAQRKSLKTAKTGMAITMDIGKEKSIHPGNKQDVGKRLALLALANDYGKDLVSSGPLYKSHKVVDEKIILEFDHVGSGLSKAINPISGFEIAEKDGQFRTAMAYIIDDKIEVFAEGIAEPAIVRYAWKDASSATLFNREGLPASSFSTE